MFTYDQRSGRIIQSDAKILKAGDVAVIRLVIPKAMSIETFKEYGDVGRVHLKIKGNIIAHGYVERLKYY